MNFLVVGPGAIGSLWTYSLSKAGHNVAVWSRHHSSTCQIKLDDLPTISVANNQNESLAQADVVLVTVKAPQVISALTAIANNLNSDTIIVLMHNGMGTAQPIAKQFPTNPIVLATTTHGAYKDQNNRVQHTGKGITHLGGYNDKGKQCDFLADVFDHALPHSSWNNDIEQALWHKLAINCAINPLTAIHQVNNGQLAELPFKLQVSDLLSEVVEVMLAEGIATSIGEMSEKVAQVVKATASNHSSMKQDIYHHRYSEIDFITGYLLQRAQANSISAPANTKLFNQIKAIEQSWKSS